ncbi:MAG: hypothetical protein E6529_01085 [[Ruminococcus] lactaris]|uniref:hypothetical protein n=1 Tax=[Ruminococcus] lactaris TaxID=46228 RepID=UPI002908CEA2|nr:hypothetical protein [[Ruminococcus] lactaris]MDU6469461.1 hypothetical protein [[Ruminococcus] lactaris]
MMLGSKAPNNDVNGLFRATHSHNPTHYSHIMVLTPHFYAHIVDFPSALYYNRIGNARLISDNIEDKEQKLHE